METGCYCDTKKTNVGTRWRGAGKGPPGGTVGKSFPGSGCSLGTKTGAGLCTRRGMGLDVGQGPWWLGLETLLKEGLSAD